MTAATLQRARPETCHSDLALERFLLGELQGAALAATEQHLGACTICRDRCAALAAGSPEQPDLLWWRRQQKTRERRRRAPLVAALAGLAAVAAAIALVPRLHGPAAPADTRVKGGGFALELVARHADGRVGPVFDGASLRPGDAIRFVVTAPEATHVAVVGLDAAGQVSVYAPAPGASLDVATGTHTLPGSVVLDATAGDERFVALFCAAAPTRAALTGAGARALAAASGDPRRAPPLDLPCRQVATSIHRDTGR